MKNTTVSISKDLKNKLLDFGEKSETFSEIIEKIYKCAKQQQLREILMNEKDCISVEEALENARKKWQE